MSRACHQAVGTTASTKGPTRCLFAGYCSACSQHRADPAPTSRGPLCLLARGADRHLGVAAACRASFRPPDRPQLAATSPAAEEQIASIGFEPGDPHTRRHFEPLQNLSRSGIDSPQIAAVLFPGAVPELSLDPGDSGDEAGALDGAKNRACFGIHLMDLPVFILPDPERPFGPGEP